MKQAVTPTENRLRPVPVVALATLLTIAGVVPIGVGPAAADVGVVGPSYAPVSAPTGEKPQSKLWFAQAAWWGVLFSSVTSDHTIHRLDPSTARWFDTGVVVDNRNAGNSDVLWDGSRLYVATAVRPGASASDHAALLRRYTYDTGGQAYRLETGFPVALATVPAEAIGLDKDTTGAVWITWTAPNGGGGLNVYVTHTTAGGTAIVAPFVVPVAGASNLTTDDISAVVAFRSQIGVMWSNQNSDIMYFATHRDGDPDATWQVNPAVQGPGYADDHMNLKSLQADPSGDVFAALKTEQRKADAPLILLVVLRNGSWTRYTFGTVADDHTRPLVLIDAESRELYVFATSPCCSGGIVYMKQTPLDHISFAPGLGTPFIQSTTNVKINNPTSTKQGLGSTTGLVVLAGDDGTQLYVHNSITLSSKVDTIIDEGPTGIVRSQSASFAFSSVPSGATFECALDDAPFAACTSPSGHGGLADGPHTFRVRAIAANGSVDPTPATRTWTVDLVSPEIITQSPADGQAAVAQEAAVTAVFSEPMDGATVSSTTFTLARDGVAEPVMASVSYDATTRSGVLRPAAPLDVASQYTAIVVGGADGVTDSAGTAMERNVSWRFTTVATDTRAPQTTVADSGPSGTVDRSSATFSFYADEPGGSFECRLDDDPFAPCGSPVTFTALADGAHQFAVRAIDAAGNIDPTPATRSWAVAATLFSDGFESGGLSLWARVGTAGTGSVVVQSDVVHAGTFAARLSATTAPNSYAYVRSELAAGHTELTVSARHRALDEGAAGRQVQMLKLSGAEGVLVTVFRENSTGLLHLRYGGGSMATAGHLPLGAWAGVTLRVVTGGLGAGTVELAVDGAVAHRSSTASVGTSGVSRVQFGSDQKREAFSLAMDDVSLRG